MKNTYYKIKEIKQVQYGDIILHPLYRSDGLMLVNRYKSLTPSLLNHISKHFLSDTPVLIVESEEVLQSFLLDKIEQNQQFINDLEKIKKFHQKSIMIPLKFESYHPYTGKDTAPSKQLTNNDENLILPLLHSPFWNSLDIVFDSYYLKRRAKRVKAKFERVLKNDHGLISLLNIMKDYHDSLYIHAINSTGIALLLGLSLELDDESLVDLGIASMFADIGFTTFNKKSFISYLDSGKKEIELLNGHIKQSVEMISRVKIATKKSIISGILDHHEHVDGSGHPFRKRQNVISLFGKIIAIAQAYDEKLGGYISNTSIPALKSQYYIWSEGGKRFDRQVIKAFVFRSSLYRLGQTLSLPNQKMGIIVGFENYAEEPILPKVKLENNEIINFYHLRDSLS